jgi:hypothetical protein
MLPPILKWFAVTSACLVMCASARADVLIVADEFPAMEVVGKRLKDDAGVSSRIVDQNHFPDELSGFQAVVVYIHKELQERVERACIDYAQAGGHLVLLHHSISSGKRENRYWFPFLGVELPKGEVDQGGYKWIEGVTVHWVDLAQHVVMTNSVQYPERVIYPVANASSQSLPAFTLRGTEVYLNHVLKGEHTLLMALQFTDKSGKTWTQATAGWRRQTGKGSVTYFAPGHTLHDFEDATYGRIVVNAITR